MLKFIKKLLGLEDQEDSNSQLEIKEILKISGSRSGLKANKLTGSRDFENHLQKEVDNEEIEMLD